MSVAISVVVPTHNGIAHLPRSLAHIAAQRVPSGLEWEVVLVDNASSDGTREAAENSWPSTAPVPLRVVNEPVLGLARAHLRGFAEARHEIVTWVEDDNLIAPDWLEVVAEVTQAHPEAAAFGGLNEALCESPPPAWFAGLAASYAVGPQGEPGDVTWTRGYLWGAGMTVRREAWQGLLDGGFRPLLPDRSGRRLNSGGDTEICFALRQAGWRLRYEPRLRMRHALGAQRLDWRYLRRLWRGVGCSTVVFDAYNFALDGLPAHLRGRDGPFWSAEVLETTTRLAAYGAKGLAAAVLPLEGRKGALDVELLTGRLQELLRRRGAYDRGLQEVATARWRKVFARP